MKSNTAHSEIFRSEKYRNPFRFGTIVDEPYFTNRISELSEIRSILDTRVHLILMSPRRFGKTSLILKAVNNLSRPVLFCDLQIITSEIDFAEQLLKKLHHLFPLEKIKSLLKTFRIVPIISMNPLSNEVNISFNATDHQTAPIEDVLNLCQKVSSSDRPLIIIFDEFQEIRKIGAGLEKNLRSIIQHHDRINYVFLGSQESMIRDIFQNNKSPFYHFGRLLRLSKISDDDFRTFLMEHFRSVSKDAESISDNILKFTHAHPYYTQQLAFYVWERMKIYGDTEREVQNAIDQIITIHNLDFDRIWATLNRTDMKILVGMAYSSLLPLSNDFARSYKTGSTSTTYSALSRLISRGYVLQTNHGYEIEDPFFKQWIISRRGEE